MRRRSVTRDDRMTVPGASLVTSASTSSSTPPGSETNAPCGEGFMWSARNARMTLPCCRSASTRRGNSALADSRSTSPAWMPASSGSARYSTASSPNRRLTNAASDSSFPEARRGTIGSIAIRTLARQPKRLDSASGASRIGKPSADPSINGCNRPSRMTYAVRGVSVGWRRSAMPSSRHRETAAGFCTSSESGPASIVQSSIRSVRITPPARGAASSTRTVSPRFCSSNAAASPVMPAPTTATSSMEPWFI